MDDIVRQAMAKWPDVPHCFGWLGLDVRGHWCLRDAEAQACGAFASGVPGARGQRLEHQNLIAFIGRNYGVDAGGRWYFQNGPQRVFVELELTPWVWRLSGNGRVHTHTGLPVQVHAAWEDEGGRVYLSTAQSVGLVHSQDMHVLADEVEAGRWTPQPVHSGTLPQRFAYVPSPQASQV